LSDFDRAGLRDQCGRIARLATDHVVGRVDSFPFLPPAGDRVANFSIIDKSSNSRALTLSLRLLIIHSSRSKARARNDFAKFQQRAPHRQTISRA
jgi:hypothetical protein